MIDPELQELRDEIDVVNTELLTLMNRRLRLVERVKVVKERNTYSLFNPKRESEMFDKLLLTNAGPMTADLVRHLFKEIFKLSLDHMEADTRNRLEVHRREGQADRVYELRGHALGAAGAPVVIAGPATVESQEQADAVAAKAAALGFGFLQGGAFKARTSPYSFQGHGVEGLKMLRAAADRHGLAVISECLDPRHVEAVAEYADVISVGNRNMFNYELLKLLGQAGRPVLIKRSFMGTLHEYIHALEYVAKEGNHDLILCERGIRTHERWTAHTMDVAAVALLKQETPFPVLVDVSVSAGRKDVMAPLARAALAAGADGLMLQVHPAPELALTDNEQQMDLDELESFAATVFA